MQEKEKIHIAYADDHDLVRIGISSIINTFENFQVDFQATNGKDLINKLEIAKTLPNICLLDINMPVMNGFDTLVAIKSRWPEMKVLILTVCDIEMYIIRTILNGANGYVIKESKPEELKKAMLAIYTNGYYYSETVSGHFFKSVLSKEKKLTAFTATEVEVLKFSCTDLSYPQIAEKMKKTTRSIESHKERLFDKLQIHSRQSLVMKAIELGYIPLQLNRHPVIHNLTNL
jgi:two-component system invasion response regulator UvrY